MASQTSDYDQNTFNPKQKPSDSLQGQSGTGRLSGRDTPAPRRGGTSNNNLGSASPTPLRPTSKIPDFDLEHFTGEFEKELLEKVSNHDHQNLSFSLA